MTEKLSIARIKDLLKLEDVSSDLLKRLEADERKGVRQALLQYDRRKKQQEKLEEDFKRRLAFEKELAKAGYRAVAGIDEVGRGPLAGPVVAAAVILPLDFHEILVTDSKKLSLEKREFLYDKIMTQALAVGIGEMSEAVIDDVNIYRATQLAMIQAVENLKIAPDYLLLDAMKLALPLPQESLIKGDGRSVSIGAASIVAKITRDHLMVSYDQLYPGYGFAHNAGYGTQEHLDGLAKYGITPIHRKTFAPVKEYL